ncbi:MAG TPA: PP2C family protein-serine/threonine phosphatase [candidate division Zixibacteria bacterium]|nr:PP2C family protein-serine/threonine phosphatase [candidate division Zixibacteria bacterium]
MDSSSKNELAHDWPEPKQFKRSIRLEFSLYISSVIFLLMLASGYIMTDRYVDTVTRAEVEKLLVQARSYSAPAGKLIISTNGPDALLLNNICQKLASDNPDIYWVGIADRDGKFLAHTDIKKIISGSHLSVVASNQFRDVIRDGEAFDIASDTILITVPINEGSILVGRLGVASSASQIAQARRQSIVTVITITIVLLLIGIPITMALLHRKLSPITLITDSLKKVDFDKISFNVPITDRNEFGYLSETLRVMGTKLNSAQQQMIERERIAREMEIAREIQSNILPAGFPSGPEFSCFGAYRSAREVGGDYYDFIDYGEHKIGFLVADVSGKSLPGMLVMLLTRDIVKRVSRNIDQPDRLLSEVNREISANIKKGMFVTMFLGVLDRRTGAFDFASAGHNPLIRISAATGETDLIKTKGFPLGMMPPGPFSSRIELGHIALSPGDWLVQYTDGINEAPGKNGEEFGMDRLVGLVSEARTRSSQELVESVMKNHAEFVADAEQFDDITLMALKWLGVRDDIENNTEEVHAYAR